MIKPVIFYMMVCNRCGNTYSDYDDHTCFPDDDMMCYADDWAEINGRHFCPNCHTYNDETDEITVKPPYPDKLQKLKVALNSGIFTHISPDFSISEDEEYYKLSNSYSISELPESAKTLIKETLGEDTKIIAKSTGHKIPGLYAGAPDRDGYKFTILLEKKKNDK